MRYLTTFLLALILFSCTKKESFKKESWYKITNASYVDTVLIKESYFNMDNKLLMQIRFRPSEKIQSVFVYDNNEKVKEWTAYYDTLMQNGQKCNYTYENGEVVEQTFINFQKDSKPDTIVAKIRNTFDANQNLIKAEMYAANDTNQMIYKYNNEGLIEEQSFILTSGEIQSINKSKYDKNNNLIWRKIEYPDKQKNVTEINNYQDSILLSKLLLADGDTIRQEKYIYNNGENSEIEIFDKQENYKIIIVNQIIEEMPAANTQYSAAGR